MISFNTNNLPRFIFKSTLAAGLLAGSIMVPSAFCASFASSPSFASYAQDQAAPASTKPADDTAHNKKHNTTADQQGNSKADVDMTAAIRKSILADKSLSTYAHNVKVITEDGVVTLRGPVRSDAEMQTILAKATDAAGADKVQNRITVKAAKQASQ